MRRKLFLNFINLLLKEIFLKVVLSIKQEWDAIFFNSKKKRQLEIKCMIVEMKTSIGSMENKVEEISQKWYKRQRDANTSKKTEEEGMSPN